MGSVIPAAGRKRKAAPGSAPASATDRKRQKFWEARSPAVQTADRALTKNGELNIASFIQAREYEITELEKSMRKARQVLTTRAFQQVPRHLRRRTASHNAKRVPRRLQQRARREMKEDNTPIVTSRTRSPASRVRRRLQTAQVLTALNRKQKLVRQKKKEAKVNAKESDPAKHISISRVPRIRKNTLAIPSATTPKFKRRQINKTWLPTHLWHTKRARMPRPVEPLWRMAIPLTPSEKSYRPSHRAAGNRGAIAWDMSYMSTIGCLGTESALDSLLTAFNFTGTSTTVTGTRAKGWKLGTRTAASWLCRPDQKDELIAPAVVIWAPHFGLEQKCSEDPLQSEGGVTANILRRKAKSKLDRRLFIRVHPSSFHEFWLHLLKVAKTQRPQVLIEDLRFEIGSIEVTGTGSTEALLGVLKPTDVKQPTARLWSSLAGLANPASLPLNVVLPLTVTDPRLSHPPKQLHIAQDESSRLTLLQTLTDWPVNQHHDGVSIFSHKQRHAASKLPSQKAMIRRRTSTTAVKKGAPTSTNVPIPTMLLARRSQQSQSNSQGSWTVMAPWKCIDPIWRSLMYYPLTTGGTPRFGGLWEQQQIAFERSVPWFPGDSPGTAAGKAWERTQSETRFDEWIRKPPSRRLSYATIDLGLGRRGEVGRGWSCDWALLFESTTRARTSTPKEHSQLVTQIPLSDQTPLTQRQRKLARAKSKAEELVTERRRNSSSPESEISNSGEEPEPEFVQLSTSRAMSILAHPRNALATTTPGLVTVRIVFLTKGTPDRTARIYRIPRVAAADETLPQPGQLSPMTLHSSVSSQLASKTAAHVEPSLRSRWLRVYSEITQNDDSSTSAAYKPIAKQRTNRFGMPPKHHAYTRPSLDHLNVLPPNAPQEVIDQYGPKPPTEAAIQAQREADLRVKMEEQATWDSHVPCPGVEDLIGYVTSGGYNLAEGRGTAIGSLWLQRIAEGWSGVDATAEAVQSDANGFNDRRNESNQEVHRRRPTTGLSADRERYLCIVRNSGESIGRLARWAVCE